LKGKVKLRFLFRNDKAGLAGTVEKNEPMSKLANQKWTLWFSPAIKRQMNFERMKGICCALKDAIMWIVIMQIMVWCCSATE